MKLILTGATGFVGGVVLARLLGTPDVTGVTCLTRRPLDVTHPKLTTSIPSDFSSHPPDQIEGLAGHDGCIWTLGGKASDFASPDEYARVTHGYTLALATGLAERAPRFNFCYLSGMGADPSESARLPWERMTRHLKGRTERDLRRLTLSHPGFAAYCFRPGGILPKRRSPTLMRLLRHLVVDVDALASAMIHVALRGDGRSVISNAEIAALSPR